MKFEEIIVDSDCKAIMLDISKCYGKSLDREELKSLMLEAAWLTAKEFDKDHPKKMKLTTYLANRLKWKIMNVMRTMKQKTTGNPIILEAKDYTYLTDIFESLPSDERYLFQERFISNKSIKELATEYNVSENTILKRCLSIKNKVKKMYLNK